MHGRSFYKDFCLMKLTPNTSRNFALFGMGCFWSPEAVFRHEPGVTATAVGYAGGHVPNPTYERVCRKDTGHVETVLIAYDLAVTTYEALLETFFENHEPGFAKPGSQYRSVIFALNADQERQAIAAIEGRREAGQTIATTVETIQDFWPAEAYHQQYYERRGLAKQSILPCAVPESEFAPTPPAPIHGW